MDAFYHELFLRQQQVTRRQISYRNYYPFSKAATTAILIHSSSHSDLALVQVSTKERLN